MTLEQFIRRSYLLANGMLLQLAFAQQRLHSMIFLELQGVGKTTLARLVASSFDLCFIALSVVLAGVKDIRDTVKRAQMVQGQGRSIMLFIDKAHRFNKAVKHYIKQQVIRLVVQLSVLPHCSVGVKHG